MITRRITHIFTLFAKVIARKILSESESHIARQDHEEDIKEDVLKKLKAPELLEKLMFTVLDYLQWGQKYWLWDVLNAETAGVHAEGLKEEFMKAGIDQENGKEPKIIEPVRLTEDMIKLITNGYQVTKKQDRNEFKEYAALLNKDLFGTLWDGFVKDCQPMLAIEITNIVLDMRKRLASINSDLNDINAYVKLDAGYLKGLDDSKVSNINIKVNLQNYLWTEIDQSDNRLIQE